jgi:hypothetical protein
MWMMSSRRPTTGGLEECSMDCERLLRCSNSMMVLGVGSRLPLTSNQTG